MFGYWNIFDFESRIVHRERMLTLLNEHENYGFILDSSYEIHKNVPLLHRQETETNMHEFNVFDDGSRALFPTHTDPHATREAAKAVGFDGPCIAKYQGFREVDVESIGAQEVVFDWDARHHIGLDEVMYLKYDGSIEEQCTRGWDILHLNSVVKFPDDDYLLSARHSDAVYKISHTDGTIVWRLGGVKSDFMQDGWKFSRQHHALILEQNNTHTVLTIFDNGIGDGPFEKATSDRARALTILLDTMKMRADIIGEYKQPRGERTNARGSFQTLPNGNKFICWAYNSYISEHGPDGTLVMDAQIPIKLRSYRAFKHPWTGSPSEAPRVHAEAITVEDELMTVIHGSWNGDTQAVLWKFSQLDDQGSVQTLGSTDRVAFETRFEYKTLARHVFAEALDAKGHILGKSEVTTTLRPLPLEEGSSGPVDVPESKQEHAPIQEGGYGGTASASGPSTFRTSGAIFAIGVACGIFVTALAWICRRLYQRRGVRIMRKEQDTMYMPLQQDTE